MSQSQRTYRHGRARPFAITILFVGLVLLWVAAPFGAAEAGHEMATQTSDIQARVVETATAEETETEHGKSKETAQVVLPTGPQTPLPAGDADINQLLRLWGVFGNRVDASCARLHVGELHCLAERGTLDMLQLFNRPAMLLLDYDGHKQWVLLSKLDKEQATLVGGKGARHVTRERLRDMWTGRYELIWRADAGSMLIYEGMQGSAVVWLRQRLATITGDSADIMSTPGYFGRRLTDRVRKFQSKHGLQPDGLVGPRTQIVLNGLSRKSGEPTLAANDE